MNKKKYITLTLMLSLLSINNVYADCTQQAIDEFKSIEDQYKITTEYNRETKTYTMRIEEGKPDKYEYIFVITYQYQCNKINNKLTECTGLKPGTSFYTRIKGNTKECNSVVKEEKIKLKKNNEYYGDPLCKGIEEFVLCQEFYDREIDRETFEKRIEMYKISKGEKNKSEKIKNEKNTTNKILKFIKKNLVQLIISIVLIILLIISLVIKIKSSRKSRRLE